MNLHFSKKRPISKVRIYSEKHLENFEFSNHEFYREGTLMNICTLKPSYGIFFLNLKKRKFLSFYCRTSLCVLIDLVQQGVLLSYNLTRLILAHAGYKIIVVQSKSCLSFHFYLIPLLVFIRGSTLAHFYLYDSTYKSSGQCTGINLMKY